METRKGAATPEFVHDPSRIDSGFREHGTRLRLRGWRGRQPFKMG